MSFQKVVLLGRLGASPESKTIKSGVATNFSLATSEKWKGSDGQNQERTEWHRIVVYGKLAEICAKFLTKGSLCLVEGRIHTRQWEDKDGNVIYRTEIVASTVQFLDSKKSDQKDEDEIPY